jgi:hypothetical protein
MNKNIIVKQKLELEALEDNFHLPLSEIAHEQFCKLDIYMQTIQLEDGKDTWSYIWGSRNYYASKAYKHLVGSQSVHPAFQMDLDVMLSTKAQSILFVFTAEQTEYKRVH